MCRRKCDFSELYAEREEESVFSHSVEFRVSKMRKAFQQADRQPAVASDDLPSKRTPCFSSDRLEYCCNSDQLSRALSSVRMVEDGEVDVA